jgi:RNAse (barnase) inhibitor barstar
MPTVRLDGKAITDWPSFHAECQKKFDFPDFYGRNMDAWIDCLSTLRDDDHMSAFMLAPDEVLQIEIENSQALKKSSPEMIETLLDCIDAVNERYTENGEKPALELLLR